MSRLTSIVSHAFGVPAAQSATSAQTETPNGISKPEAQTSSEPRSPTMDLDNQPANPAAATATDPAEPAAPSASQSSNAGASDQAALAQARSDGEAVGAEAARSHIAAVMDADGIKGDAAKTVAAVDLACKAPGMSVDNITAFVSTHAQGAPTKPGASLRDREAQDEEPLPAAGAEGGKQKSALSTSIDQEIAALDR